MNDDFLTRFRKPPPRAFAAQLYKRINTPMNTQRHLVMRRFSFAAAICLALLAALAFSPDARAAFNGLIRQIGGITFFGPEETASQVTDRKSTRLNSSHSQISYAVFCLKKKKKKN